MKWDFKMEASASFTIMTMMIVLIWCEDDHDDVLITMMNVEKLWNDELKKIKSQVKS